MGRGRRRRRESHRVALGGVRAEIARHDHERVAEVHHAPAPVRQPPVFQYLEQDVEDVRVRLLDLVEQYHAERAAADGFGELPAVVVADVSRRRAHQARHRVLLHVLRHVHARHVLLVVEQELGERPRQLRLAHAGRAEKDEAADGPVRVSQPGAGAADGVGHRRHRRTLPDDALVQAVFHVEQPVRLAFEQPVDGDPRPRRHERPDVFGADDFRRVLVRRAALGGERVPLRFQPQALGAQRRRAFVVGARGRRRFFVRERAGARVHLRQSGRLRLRVHPQLRRRLVYQVDRLVGQQPVRHVPAAQANRRLYRRVLHRHAVMRFVLRAQPFQHRYRGVGVRLLHEDGLEAAL